MEDLIAQQRDPCGLGADDHVEIGGGGSAGVGGEEGLAAHGLEGGVGGVILWADDVKVAGADTLEYGAA
jgi:hypothetical protein